jgi:serine/threonine protein kinase
MPLENGQPLGYAIQIGDALDKAHRHGVTHRDLKPGNIMLTKSGAGSTGSPQVKLLDFGLAKVQQAGLVTTQTIAATMIPPHNYDLAPDGDRFLLVTNRDAAAAPVTPIVVVLNWKSGLKQ